MKRDNWHTGNIARGRLTPVGEKVPFVEINMPTGAVGKTRAKEYVETAMDAMEVKYYGKKLPEPANDGNAFDG